MVTVNRWWDPGLQLLWALKKFWSWNPRRSELCIGEGSQLLVMTKCAAMGIIRFSFLQTYSGCCCCC